MTQIVVLGMHESGAEEVACLINSMVACEGQAAVDSEVGGSRIAAGAWGQSEVVRLNDRALTALGKSWVDCGALDLNEMPEAELSNLQRVANRIIHSLNVFTPWTVSDPRMSLLLELWRPLFVRPLYVIAHRSASAAALRVKERYGLPAALGLALWERYNLAALANTANFPRALVDYDRLLGDPQATAQQLRSELLELGVERLGAPPRAALQAIATMASEGSEVLGDRAIANQAQRQLEACLQDRSALQIRPPAISAPAATILARAGERWVGQRWLQRLLRKRNEELRLRRSKLKALRTQTIAANRRPGALPNSPTADRSRGVFVIGCPRSGTSILSWALAKHPNFWTSGESDYLLQLFGEGRVERIYRQTCERSDQGWLHKEEVGFTEFAAALGLGPERLFDSRSGGRRWVEATPSYTLMTEGLLDLFPAASFLHIVRDGRAVVNSMLSSGFDIDWASDFDAACRTWVHYASLGRKAVEDHADRVIEVRHDDLSQKPWDELARVFEFLGERIAHSSIDIILTRRINSSYGNVAADDIRMPKDPAAAPQRPWEAWTDAQRATFAEIAGETMRELGYGDSGGSAPTLDSPAVNPRS